MTLAGKYGLGRQGETPPRWQPSFAYDLGDLVQPISPTGYYHRCIVSGTSGAASPGMLSHLAPNNREQTPNPPVGGWPTTPGAQVADGAAVWTCVGLTEDAFLPSTAGSEPPVPTWTPGAAFNLGDFCHPSVPTTTDICMRCTSGGVTGSSEPAWPASDPLTITAPLLGSPGGTSVVDGGATWVVIDRRLILPSGAGVLLGDGSQLFGPIP